MGPLGKDKMDKGHSKHQFSLVFEIPRKILGKEKATLEGQTGTANCYFNTAIENIFIYKEYHLYTCNLYSKA